MELALLVYLISLLPSVGATFGVIAVTGPIVCFFAWVAWSEAAFKTRFWPAVFTMFWLFSVLVTMLIPSERTAYLMVGAYATQKIAEAPKTQQLGAEVLKIIELKIKHYSEEAEKEMLEKLAKEKK